MNPAGANSAGHPLLREWLRNERRLGIQHLAVNPQGGLLPTIEASSPAPTPSPQAARERMPQSSQADQAHDLSKAAVPGALPVPLAVSREFPALCDRDLPPQEAAAELEKLNAAYIRDCTRCVLHQQRTQTVFGVGNPRPELVFVGEGPGADEDAQGEPFVGRAGQLLTKMIGAMQLSRADVYICNVVKCRPPENRTPTEEEMQTCSPFLFRQLAILRPRVIVTLGRPATQTLLATTTPIGKLRGQWHDFPPLPLGGLGLPKCKLMPTFHPAYLLRSPDEKGKAWSDLQQVMAFLGIPVPQR